MNQGESYSDLGGQLPDETQRERGLRKVAELKERMKRADKPCDSCGHHIERWHLDGVCTYPVAPRGEPCGCSENGESDG